MRDMDRAALADFLRRHRETLRPEDVGLPPGARRRAPGLRREEVALLAAMSTDYYTRLEQRRGPQPSEQMLASLARALRLTADERDYLYRVAGHNTPDRISGAGHVSPALQRVLDRLEDTPALVLSSLGETLVQNRMAVALLGDRSGYTGLERSEYYRWFAHPESARAMYPEDDRDRQSRAQVASLRDQRPMSFSGVGAADAGAGAVAGAFGTAVGGAAAVVSRRRQASAGSRRTAARSRAIRPLMDALRLLRLPGLFLRDPAGLVELRHTRNGERAIGHDDPLA